jgi:hypothetical protein
MTTPNPLFSDNGLVNPKMLRQYLKTFNELHNLHAKQNENLRKLVENHEKRIIALTEKIEDLK